MVDFLLAELSGKRDIWAERRMDGADGPFTRREFIEYYGQAEGLAAWRAAAPSGGARGGGER